MLKSFLLIFSKSLIHVSFDFESFYFTMLTCAVLRWLTGATMHTTRIGVGFFRRLCKADRALRTAKLVGNDVASDTPPTTTSFVVNLRTLVGYTDALRRVCRETTISFPLGSVASYLIYADVRLHIPMTHNNDRPASTSTWDVRNRSRSKVGWGQRCYRSQNGSETFSQHL